MDRSGCRVSFRDISLQRSSLPHERDSETKCGLFDAIRYSVLRSECSRYIVLLVGLSCAHPYSDLPGLSKRLPIEANAPFFALSTVILTFNKIHLGLAGLFSEHRSGASRLPN